jgi:hypothetical protein
MNTMPMFDVIPVTGQSQGQGPVCFVCKLGSAPVVAAFIKSEKLESASPLLEQLQRMSDSKAELQAFVVCQGLPDESLKQRLRTFAEEKHLTISLTVLPEGQLPPSIPVSPDAENTVLFYRGRQIVRKIENIGPDIDGAFLMAAGRPATFNTLDQAADDMLSRP